MNATRRRSRKRGGFTLVEMIVATVLLAIAIVAALSCFNSVLRSTTTADRLHTATLLAQRHLTERELQGSSLSSGQQQGDFGAEYPGYRWQENVEPTEFENLLRLTLIVSWGEGENPPNRAFVTFVRTDADQMRQQQRQGAQSGQGGQGNAGARPGGAGGAGGGATGG